MQGVCQKDLSVERVLWHFAKELLLPDLVEHGRPPAQCPNDADVLSPGKRIPENLERSIARTDCTYTQRSPQRIELLVKPHNMPYDDLWQNSPAPNRNSASCTPIR